MYHYLYYENGFYEGMTETKPEHNRWTIIAPTFTNVKDKWDGVNWIEGATPEEIAEANKEKVPLLISQLKLRKQLIYSGISIDSIYSEIAKLPQPKRDLVYSMWEYSVVFERNDATLNSMAQMLNISNEQLDNIFIEGNKL